MNTIATDGRCFLPSTHIRGGGYLEVECYCEAHAAEAAKKYKGDPPEALDPKHGCLDTTVGLIRNRRRCQWTEPGGDLEKRAAALAEETKALYRRVATLEQNTYLGLIQQWPDPQPIETAPLGQLLAWDPSGDVSEGFGPAWAHEYSNPGMTVEQWRALLTTWGRTHWLPMPPVPEKKP